MFVVFWKDQEVYYSDSKENNHWTKDIDAAVKFRSLERATNYVKVALKDKKNEIEYIDVTARSACKKVLSEEEAELAYQKLLETIEAFGEVAEMIPSIKDYYCNIVSKKDKEQEDILHKIEFIPAANFMLVKLGRMLKICRKERREAKNKVGYLYAIEQATPITLLKAHKEHEEFLENRSYRPRVLTELFR